MKSHFGFLILCSGLVAVASAVAGSAEKASVALQPIFNGKDLSGWNVPSPNPFWRVENGVLIGTNDEKLTGSMLRTKKAYGDFVLEFDARWNGEIDSGVMFREPELQLQIGVSRSLKRDLTGSFYVRKIGYPESGQAKNIKAVLKPGDWNAFRLEARGSTFTVWINGRKVSTYIDKKFPGPGPLGLQIHANLEMTVEFRNIRAAELK